MGARRTGRERALQALYQMEMSQVSGEDALAAAWQAEPDEPRKDPESDAFARELVEGVQAHIGQIDETLQQHSHNWRLDRMGRIDRNVLRLAAFELMFRSDIPKNVTLNEAVELGKRFGNEESSAFINGLLDWVAIALGKA